MTPSRSPIATPTHPWQPRKVLKDSYSKHVSGLLIIKMGRAEQKIRAEIAKEQVYHWSQEQIRARFG